MQIKAPAFRSSQRLQIVFGSSRAPLSAKMRGRQKVAVVFLKICYPLSNHSESEKLGRPPILKNPARSLVQFLTTDSLFKQAPAHTKHCFFFLKAVALSTAIPWASMGFVLVSQAANTHVQQSFGHLCVNFITRGHPRLNLSVGICTRLGLFRLV